MVVRHHLHAVPAFLAVAILGCAHVDAEKSPDQPLIKDIRINGTKQLDDEEIKKKILTSETPWWGRIWPFNEVHYFDPNAWQADLKRIERYYQAQGYYQARVLSQEVVPAGEDAVRLRVDVEEGQPTVISKVEIRGLEALPAEHREAALADLPLKQGEVFLEEDWAGLKQKIQGALREEGYAEAKVEGEVAVDVSTREASVDLTITPGQRYRFGEIFVAQDDRPKVPAKRVIEQAQGAIKATDWYSETALSEAQDRVFKMGVFGAVKVNRGAPSRASATVPVVVDVREAPFRTQKLGGGIGEDSAQNEVRVLGEHTDRNFLGGLRRLTLRAKVGYAFLPNFLEPTRRDWTFNALAELEQPRLLFRDLRGQITLGAERGLFPLDYFQGRVKAGAIWQPTPELSIFPSYNLEIYRLSGTITRAAIGSQGLGCIPDPGDPESGCGVRLSYAEVTVEYDQRNDRSEPRNGYYAALSLQAGEPLLGNYTYLRFQPDFRFYKTFERLDRFTLSARIKLGTLVPLGSTTDSPIVARFFSGGGSSMRGFPNRRLAPLTVLPESFPQDPRDNTIPVGGKGLFESSVEGRYRITDKLAIALFLDMGFVTAESFRFGDPGFIPRHLFYAVGIGARYLTPVGPFRLDLARRLNAGPPLLEPAPFERPVGCFGLFPTGNTRYAGWPEDYCAFHLSIGEAF